ncbi:PBPRA1643 family SWIM/SEC-C metal-binding motif protein [Vibrio lentus]|uniref:Zinc chelation protein SecC n=1 Tax=Vibrio lentus TaxID=136468 RepID=A0AA45A8A3_9VIBR|nr:PBPRA1643 family SWIM/SEC-C metal-binding motif protein [Vibrio lentus]MCB5358538.1 zinc chelation protein SecC [Vibrio lentus]MCB5449006.1 zinc chelation protein SecC [Vibrio lentus]MCB5460893.1 zinc chelation protein SecC [Vibrio lentus]MCC4795269.1 SEC-C domain-containing protein [Vibrio lentus]MCC4853220.1 SEC-C domain-containing protein [Vibrio lentus]
MSKLFFKGRIETRQNHVLAGYNVNRDVKAGTEESPVNVMVQTEARKTQVEAIAAEHSIFVAVSVDAEKEENTLEFDTLLNKPKTMTFEKTPNRNDPCSCGSGKKYKKCCA